MVASDRALRTNSDVIEFLQPNGGGQWKGVVFVWEGSLELMPGSWDDVYSPGVMHYLPGVIHTYLPGVIHTFLG